jgi:hypothetical protein
MVILEPLKVFVGISLNLWRTSLPVVPFLGGRLGFVEADELVSLMKGYCLPASKVESS